MEHHEARDRLEAERSRLDSVRASIAEDDIGGESETASIAELSSAAQHQADLGTETFEREKDLSVLEQVEIEMADVEHALQRLDDGTYGTCEACGQPIDDARLEALPAARYCVAHQREAEGGLPLR